MDDPDRGALAQRLKALGSLSRLQIVLTCQDPRPVSDIKLKPSQGTGSEERQITREGVRHHLNKLRSAGLIEVEDPEGKGGREQRYRTRRQTLYELAEILASLAASPANGPAEAHGPPTWETPDVDLPTLTVVRGPEPGRTFPLEEGGKDRDRGWVLGRGLRADLQLDWDPFADDQAAEIVSKTDGYRLVDMRPADQRVSLNGQALDRGEDRPLAHGDLIGVGRTLFSFRNPDKKAPTRSEATNGQG